MKKLLLILLCGVMELSAICGFNVYAEGASIYQKCTSCHGSLGEKRALGKSQVIKDWSRQKIHAALKGYQNGTYGGEEKEVMQEQVASLNKRNLRKLTDYIITVRTWSEGAKTGTKEGN